MKKIVVLGCGAHSRGHGRSLQILKNESPRRLELAAVCDLDAEKARSYATAFGFSAVYIDLDAMLNKEQPDAVLAITPVALTERIVTDLLPRGIPLMIEKPPGERSEQTLKLIEIQTAHDVAHMISFNRRFNPAMVRFRNWVADSADARAPHVVSARMLRHHRREPDFVTGTGVHLIDATLSLLGLPRTVESHIARQAGQRQPLHLGRVTCADGAIAALLFAPCAGIEEETYEVLGRDYAALIDTHRCKLRITVEAEETVRWEADADADELERNGTLNETRVFLDMLEGKRDTALPTLTDGLAALQTAEAILSEQPHHSIYAFGSGICR